MKIETSKRTHVHDSSSSGAATAQQVAHRLAIAAEGAQNKYSDGYGVGRGHCFEAYWALLPAGKKWDRAAVDELLGVAQGTRLELHGFGSFVADQKYSGAPMDEGLRKARTKGMACLARAVKKELQDPHVFYAESRTGESKVYILGRAADGNIAGLVARCDW